MADNKRFAQAVNILEQLRDGTTADTVSMSLVDDGSLHFHFEKRGEGGVYVKNVVVSRLDIEYANYDIAEDVIRRVIEAELEDDDERH